MRRSSFRKPPAKPPAPKKQAPSGYLQRAEQLIKANQTTAAHRLLLHSARRHFRNPRLWLMLARTAPDPSAAHEYYRMCTMLEPSNTLAQAGLAATRTFARDVVDQPETLIDTHTFIHTASYPASPPRPRWVQRLARFFRRSPSRPKRG